MCSNHLCIPQIIPHQQATSASHISNSSMRMRNSTQISLLKIENSMCYNAVLQLTVGLSGGNLDLIPLILRVQKLYQT